MRASRVLLLLSLGLFVVLVALGCKPATRYPAALDTQVAAKKAEKEKVFLHYGWLEPDVLPGADIPIMFVSADSQREQWKALKQYWSGPLPAALGMRTIHLGQNPLGAAASLVGAADAEVIRLKVPYGLPDPTPHIPASNPMTYAKWRLGRELFFDKHWLSEDGIACATCHNPKQGFTYTKDDKLKTPVMNPPSLINCVYNTHQFWDGRARSLEQVLQRHLDDELPDATSDTPSKKYHVSHSWGGLVPRLSANEKLSNAFKVAFGIKQPTVDAAAKALATYLRTILSGNSLYDQVKQSAGNEGEQGLLAKHFKPFLTEATMKALQRELEAPENIAVELAYGHTLFYSKGCHHCHLGWNFTDGSFHNVGVRESGDPQFKGEETGHFRHLPYGLKDKHMIGAFRTPSLRNLPRTEKYFHDASAPSLEAVLQHYNKEMAGGLLNPYLDPEWAGDGPLDTRPLHLTGESIRALALFLRTLDGEPVPDLITSAPK